MASGSDRGRRQVELILDWLASADGVAFLVDVTGDSVVRGDPVLADAAAELIASAAQHEDDTARHVALVVGGAPILLLSVTRPLPHAWVLGVLVPGELDALRVEERVERAGAVIGRALRPTFVPPLPAGSEGGSGAPALLGLTVRRRPN